MQMDSAIAKRMVIMLIALGLIMGVIFCTHLIKGMIGARHTKERATNAITVSAIEAKNEAWQPVIHATGSLRTTKGVEVTTELAGMIRRILFKPGQDIKEGTILVELNTDPDVAQLLSLQATAELAQITYDRDKLQYAAQGISKATLDMDLANLKSSLAQVEEQKANIAKKIIRAPFSGRLGISAINPGQYLNPGDKVVSLQMLDPIYVDFYLPEQELGSVQVGQLVALTSDAYPGQTFTGKITTIDPEIDVNTRNVEVEATLPNPKGRLLPGMYGEVHVITGEPQTYLTLPQTAISYNPYGDIAYILKADGKDKKGNPKYITKQTFVTVGETRGDQVSVLAGIKAGDFVVTSGQMKLKNGSLVVVNNAIPLGNNLAPKALNPQ